MVIDPSQALAGFFIALAIAVTGVGAGTITAPVLMLFMGAEPAAAVGTALVFSFIVKIPAGAAYWMKRKVDVPALLLMVAGGVPGVVAGSFLLGHLAHDRELKTVILGVVGGIVLFSALLNIVLMVKRTDLDRYHARLRKLIPFFTFLIGIEVGFSSAGAGALGTLLLMYTTNILASAVVGTDIVFGLILSAVGGGLHLSMGNVDQAFLLNLAVGGVCGAMAGVHVATLVPARPLKFALLAWLVFIGSQLLYRGIAG